MLSSSPEINKLHAAYCAATGMDLALLPASERWWYDAIKAGMQIEDIQFVVKDREKRIKEGVRRKECLLLRNFIGSDEVIQSVMEEAAAIRALKRRAQYPKGKQQVLKATGRPTEPDAKGIRSVGEVLEAMRKAVH